MCAHWVRQVSSIQNERKNDSKKWFFRSAVKRRQSSKIYVRTNEQVSNEWYEFCFGLTLHLLHFQEKNHAKSSTDWMFICDFLFFIGNFRELIEYLNGTSDLLAKNGNILDNVLETLDVQQHSLGVLYVLVAKFTNLSVSQKFTRILFRWIYLIIFSRWHTEFIRRRRKRHQIGSWIYSVLQWWTSATCSTSM